MQTALITVTLQPIGQAKKMYSFLKEEKMTFPCMVTDSFKAKIAQKKVLAGR